MGVVSGIVMAYQFGSNWSAFSDKAGPVIGPLMAYEVLSAFFLESGFLGVMLFGLDRVGKKLHFMATCLVAIGTTISAFWIIVVNSWMQTPQGYAIGANGQFYATDWLEVVFNPSMPYRLTHTLLGAYLTTALVVGAVGAWHLLKDHEDHVCHGDGHGGCHGAAAGAGGSRAWREHAATPAGQDRSHGRPL
jgi:cytochrome d ubiquinol oxidase subunit I